MKTIIELFSRFTAIQLTALLIGAAGAVLFIYGLVLMALRSVKTIFKSIVFKRKHVIASNQFKSVETSEKENLTDALASFALLVALTVIVIALAHSK